jgi:hypothetical protein
MIEYGLFNDEGCVEAGFYSKEEAERLSVLYDPEDELVIHEICPDHDEQAKDTCEACFSE